LATKTLKRERRKYQRRKRKTTKSLQKQIKRRERRKYQRRKRRELKTLSMNHN